MKFHGGANKSPHLGAVASKFGFEFAAGQMKFFQAVKFDLEFGNLLRVRWEKWIRGWQPRTLRTKIGKMRQCRSTVRCKTSRDKR